MASQYFLVVVTGQDSTNAPFYRSYATNQPDARTALATVYQHEVTAFPNATGVTDMSVQPFGGTII